MTVLRQLPKILRFIPGTAQDVRAYFLTLQYWLAAPTKTCAHDGAILVDRYAAGEREALRGSSRPAHAGGVPGVGLYDPRMQGTDFRACRKLPARARKRAAAPSAC
jgi:magnesium chelatase subunit H